MAEHILVVDDDDLIRRTVEKLLVRDGFEVTVASTGEQAVEMAVETPFDMVIADIRMPGIDGVETIKRIRAYQPDICAIVITGYASDETPIRALRLGVQDYISKPFDVDTFMHSVSRNIGKMRLEREKDALSRKLRESVISVIDTLAMALEARDPYTHGHSHRVGQYSCWMAEDLDYDETQMNILRHGGILHDIGKIAVREEVLNKPGRLTAEEYEHIKIHPGVGYNILKQIAEFENLLPIVLSHHERIDGKGYPHGIPGDEIPVNARIAAIADTFDALTSNRPYRDGMPLEKAVAILESIRGTQLDANLVDIFIRKVRERGVIPPKEAQDLTRVPLTST
ncbi:MAG: HD domain-containing phosphohydrolase [Candidatus Sericytochromatia bacterium]|nr:HD domain-containing phosphohydrolase [Candidatus Sericytochromatia bacterium]